jgi:hypothetical protein
MLGSMAANAGFTVKSQRNHLGTVLAKRTTSGEGFWKK